MQSVLVHQDLITSLAVSPDGSVVVTGSRDTTVVVLDTRPVAATSGLRLRGRPPPPLREQPRHQLAGHRDTVTAVAVSRELDLVVSGDAQGCVLLHSLSRGVVVTSVSLPGAPCAVHEIHVCAGVVIGACRLFCGMVCFVDDRVAVCCSLSSLLGPGE